jgi:hypothetical protein
MPQNHEAFSGRFAIVPGFVFRKSGLSANARLVFAALRFFSDKAGRCHPSHARLAEATGLSRGPLHEHSEPSRRAGFIERTRRISPRGTWTLQRIAGQLPAAGGGESGEVVSGRQGECHGDTGGETEWQEGSVTVTQEQYQGTEKAVPNATTGGAVSAEDSSHADRVPDLGEGRSATPDAGMGAKREGVRRRGEEGRKRDILPENGFGPEAWLRSGTRPCPGREFLRR